MMSGVSWTISAAGVPRIRISSSPSFAARCRDQLSEYRKKVIDHMRSASSLFEFLPELNMEPGGAAIDQTRRGENAYIHRNDDFNPFLNTYWKNKEEKKHAFDFLNRWLEIIEPWTNQEAYQNYPKPYLTKWSERYWAEYYLVLCMVKKNTIPPISSVLSREWGQTIYARPTPWNRQNLCCRNIGTTGAACGIPKSGNEVITG